MPVFKRNQLATCYQQSRQQPFQAYLIFGHRFLCQECCQRLETLLLEKQAGSVHAIDGSREDPLTTIARLQSYSLLPGRQIFRVTDTRLLLSRRNSDVLWRGIVRAWQQGHHQRARRSLDNLLAFLDLQTEDLGPDPGALDAEKWRQLFGFPKPEDDLSWLPLLLQQDPGSGKPQNGQGRDPEAMLQETLEHRMPACNFLILLTEAVDKRKRLFKYLKKKQGVIDLSVATGATSQAKKSQEAVLRELVENTLQQFGKQLTPDVFPLLFERVGFHPSAVVMETEKLALGTGERQRITREDLNTLVGRTRQEALFELTGALGKKDLSTCLLICGRLQEHGIHPLAVIATLRNYTRSLLLYRALGDRCGFRSSMSAAQFQHQCLEKLQQETTWSKELHGHPYALYMQFKTAVAFTLNQLCGWLSLILAAEMRLKGSGTPAALILEHLLINMLVSPQVPEAKKAVPIKPASALL